MSFTEHSNGYLFFLDQMASYRIHIYNIHGHYHRTAHSHGLYHYLR